MGGRGGASGLGRTVRMPQQKIVTPPTPPAPQVQPQQTGPIQNQVPDDNNTPVAPDPVGQFQNMSDAQLAQVFNQSKRAKLPNHHFLSGEVFLVGCRGINDEYDCRFVKIVRFNF